MLGKYEFKIPEQQEGEAETVLHFKIDTPSDKYLLDYMRLKIIDRNPDSVGSGGPSNETETEKIICMNQLACNGLRL